MVTLRERTATLKRVGENGVEKEGRYRGTVMRWVSAAPFLRQLIFV